MFGDLNQSFRFGDFVKDKICILEVALYNHEGSIYYNFETNNELILKKFRY